MAQQKQLKRYRLTKQMRAVLQEFLTMQIGPVLAAKRLGVVRSHLDSIVTNIVRDAGQKGVINIDEVLKKY